MLRKLAIAALVAGGAVLAWQALPAPPPPLDLPIERLREEAARGALPHVSRPLPDWLPLPASGRVSTAGTYPPQPPYGAAVAIMLRIDETPEDFAASYTRALAAAGYQVRRVAAPFDFTFATDGAIEAYDPASGRYVFCVLRHNRQSRFAQITFWEPPAPRF
jgi:hypothetical protein